MRRESTYCILNPFAAFSPAKRLDIALTPREAGVSHSTYAPSTFAAFSSANCLLYRSW